ncbi:hypothetical protein [Streptomyces sp. CB01881]|uniref:hypothetical protein n=1 Tax=Streptomyces sp. CB01881 TaxID=2078691 RepID=UPI000CDC5A64|nr:hypothetical protein [Streptomyces sp. CB01881]AUY53239.1 hypothetical protein C2142_34915 [Streptomyces sp. CB01881]TYC69398.1 hypothetical protein EH183_34990 [Streptomyces sp. CB01881]
MNVNELTGTYTYRSFLELPDPVDDFNKLRFAQAELKLVAAPDGAVSGELILSDPGEQPLIVMDMTGRASASSRVSFTLSGRGRPPIADFHYEYDGVILRHWETGVDQRMVLAGTVLRAEPHGGAPAGQTASFLAVRRDDA